MDETTTEAWECK
jgi:hypothetical protein